jgi:hypothetical protein
MWPGSQRMTSPIGLNENMNAVDEGSQQFNRRPHSTSQQIISGLFICKDELSD